MPEAKDRITQKWRASRRQATRSYAAARWRQTGLHDGGITKRASVRTRGDSTSDLSALIHHLDATTAVISSLKSTRRLGDEHVLGGLPAYRDERRMSGD